MYHIYTCAQSCTVCVALARSQLACSRWLPQQKHLLCSLSNNTCLVFGTEFARNTAQCWCGSQTTLHADHWISYQDHAQLKREEWTAHKKQLIKQSISNHFSQSHLCDATVCQVWPVHSLPLMSCMDVTSSRSVNLYAWVGTCMQPAIACSNL